MKSHYSYFSKFASLLLLILFCRSVTATVFVINTSNFQFAPANITLNLGDTVKWLWVSGTHTTTSVTIPPGAVAWNSPLNSTATSFIYVPAKVGSYNYNCVFHAAVMTGSFAVVCPPASVSIAASGVTTFCKGGSVMLSATPGFGSFQWKKNGVDIPLATGSTYTVTAIGNYPYTVVYTNSCGSTALSNAIQVNVKSNPGISVTPASAIICPPVTDVVFTAGGTSVAYTWGPAISLNQTAGNPVTATPLVSTTYTVTGTGANGCTATKTARVTVKPKPANLSSFNITTSGATVKWDSVGCAVGYTVQYRIGVAAWTTLNITTNTPSKIITGLLSGTTYEWRVRAKYPNATFSAYTATAFFTTLVPRLGSASVQVQNHLQVFPNPTEGSVNIEFPFEDDDAIIEVMNSTGQIVMSQHANVNDENAMELDAAKLHKGLYFIRVYNGGVYYTARFIRK